MPVDLTSPSLNLSADSNEVVTYRRDSRNYITQLFSPQLPAAETGFFNIRMSRGVMITPHWHTNTNEMVVVITGEATTSVFNPNTQRLMTYRLGPGQVAQFPKGWFHWVVSLADDTFIMAIFDRPNSDIVYAADFLRYTPKEIMGMAYGVDPEGLAQAAASIKQSVILGPPVESGNREDPPALQASLHEADEARSYPGLHQAQPGYLPPQRPFGPEMPRPYRMDPNRFWW